MSTDPPHPSLGVLSPSERFGQEPTMTDVSCLNTSQIECGRYSMEEARVLRVEYLNKIMT